LGYCCIKFGPGMLTSKITATILHVTITVISHARTCRKQTADDDVFLETAQIITLAHDRSLSQHAGGLLERRCRDERIGRQRSLGDTEQHVFVLSRQLAFGNDAIVFLEYIRALDLLFA